MSTWQLGIDIGSISINTVVLGEGRQVLEEHYTWCRGAPFERLAEVLLEVLGRYDPADLEHLALTGTGGTLAARLVGGHLVNEIVAQSASVSALHPEARSVIEMGGEDSKLISLTTGAAVRRVELEDFAMNSMCAAGTGSFLDQQAQRMGISIVGEFGELALRSRHPPRIAGRCSVFAKSDMIHLQQIATPVEDIVAGLCFAVARNFRSNLARGREIKPPVVFQGGVAANAGMVRAFRELLELGDGDFIIPRRHASMGAIGALYHVMNHAADGRPFLGLDALRSYLGGARGRELANPPLVAPAVVLDKGTDARFPAAGPLGVYLGLDIGSLSTNVVLIDDEDRVVARRYLPTASRPLEAIRRGLAEVAEEAGDRVRVLAVGTTGSGRYLTGDFVGADVIQNEITAQATAAIAYDPKVDTIFEIGGQDSKYISVDQGVVVDFEMNKVCAAGTGSFLEEQAEKLGINIQGDFGRLALSSERPARLGDRCTVFMESDLNAMQQKGVGTPDLVGGLAYSIVHNYLRKVVGTKRIGSRIFFQGGVANNRAVIAAFQAVTGKTITVPPHFDVTGAIGAAMLARARMREAPVGWSTRFRGFEVSKVPYTLDTFTCKSCANHCEIRKVAVSGRRPLFYGGRCERWEIAERKGRRRCLPDLFEERHEILRRGWREDEPADERTTIGIPRALMAYYQMFPYWRSFFESLGFRVVVSSATDRRIIQRSLEMLTAETCFPVEVVHGHVLDLEERGVDWIFVPFAVSARAAPDNPTNNYNCPWVQTYPFMVSASLAGAATARKLLKPALHFRHHPRVITEDLERFAHETWGMGADRVHTAIEAAERAQAIFEETLVERGRAVLSDLPEDTIPAVILGRPYNTGDPALNLSLVDKLIEHDVLPIPQDYLPLANERILEDYDSVYWPNGQRILAAARIAAREAALCAVYLGNFRCGPDSFLSHFVRKEMTGKPYLQLEVDEHSADAGLITRCEAFLDSLQGWRARARETPAARDRPPKQRGARTESARTLYYPYMCDGAHALAAASRACGVDAHVLPMQDETDLELARRHTTGKECFPMICTLGSFLKKMREPGFDPARTAFFMPDHGGPCRFGQYNRLDRMLFDELGYGDVAIVSPSNEDGYAGSSGGHSNRFRISAVRGVVAVDLLRKLRQERSPYELQPGEIDRVYRAGLDAVVRCVESGGRGLGGVMTAVGERFRAVRLREGPRRPVIAVVGEIFMRDNPYCSGHLVERLEALGAETLMAPFREWLTYSTLRYGRDSRWKGHPMGVLRAEVQKVFTDVVLAGLDRSVHGLVEHERDVPIGRMLELCSPYVHRDYDGDPALALGAASALARTGVSGVANILPFTCLPGTLISAVSGSFRRDHGLIPWVNVDFDGQSDTALGTRLEAFVHQATAFARRNGHDAPRVARR